MSGPHATLSHTYNPAAISEVRLNGVVAGESGINALVALGHGVPVLLVTGDETTRAETEPFCPGVVSAVVKSSVSRFAADSMHPADAREAIHDAARRAVEALSSASVPSVELPATLTVRMRNPDLAEMACWVHGIAPDGDDPCVVRITDDDPIRLYRTFITVVLLTRGIAE